MKIIFFGSDDFAQKHLEVLVASSHQVVACVTQPDRPKGRGMKVVLSPIKETALRNTIPVLQPDQIKDPLFIKDLESFSADLFVVIAYGRILPAKILNIPKIFAINVHGSLLPKYRGAAPINWAVINGEARSGLSIIKMSPKMDAGEIISQADVVIEKTETAQTLREKMMKIGAELLLKTIDNIAAHNVALTPQDENEVTFAPKLTKDLGRIDWHQSAAAIYNLVRGLLPWPSAYTLYKGKLLKILQCEPLEKGYDGCQAGEVVGIDPEGIVVAAGQGAVLIKALHLEASQRMDAASFLRGHKIEVGFQFN